ncbi:hypothetical protein [Ruegeria halocynthiae]|uniref:hypothetical protein n=1 Tax=Ruegeria halocynthiae TaxID=985054 RepID=UPI00115FEB07|nr:hypothetical protein [Ruegeria halocynthiae]
MTDDYSRRKFFEACVAAGSDCPALFSEKRSDYPVLNCRIAIENWGDLYPQLAEELLADTGYETMTELSEKGGEPFRYIFQAIYLGPAMDVMSNYPADSAEEFVTNERVFDCVYGGKFVFPDGYIDDGDLKLANKNLFSPEVRQNLIDLAHTALN